MCSTCIVTSLQVYVVVITGTKFNFMIFKKKSTGAKTPIGG